MSQSNQPSQISNQKNELLELDTHNAINRSDNIDWDTICNILNSLLKLPDIQNSKKLYPKNLDISNYKNRIVQTGIYMYNDAAIGFNISFIHYNENKDIGQCWNLLYDSQNSYGITDEARVRPLNPMDLKDRNYEIPVTDKNHVINYMENMKTTYNHRNFHLKY